MSQRISHSLLDPFIGPALKSLYPKLHIPRRFPPEGIVLIGHLFAIVGAVGFAYSLSSWWGGILAAIGVLGNHTADCVDGTHARSTGQCRHGGELLDHFTDPLSFAYWMIGIAVAVGRHDLGMAALVALFGHAVLTNIRAKLVDQFTLAAFGPTEFKTLLFLSGIALSIGIASGQATHASTAAHWSYVGLIAFGILSLIIDLVRSVQLVNRSHRPVDTSQWVIRK